MSNSGRAVQLINFRREGSPFVWQPLYIATSIFSSLGVLGKTALLKHLVPVPTMVLLALGFVGICLPFLWFVALRFRYVLGSLTILGLALASLVFFPKVQQLHAIGRGTDQPDCVIVAANGMMSAQWPYHREKLFSHNPMSCGPGWVAIQAPVVKTFGYRWNLICIWAVALVTLGWCEGLASVFGLLALLGLCPGFWLAAANGTDFLPFGIAVAALFSAAGTAKRGSVIFVIAAAMLAQFRLPLLLLPAFLTRQAGKAAALWATSIAVASQIAFLLWNPTSFVADGPMHVLIKLTGKHLIASNPFLAAIEIASPILLAAFMVVWWEERAAHKWDLLVYLYVVIFPPAVLDLIQKLKLYSGPLEAIGFWEGGMWMLACLPLTAAAFCLMHKASPLKIEDAVLKAQRVSAA